VTVRVTVDGDAIATLTTASGAAVDHVTGSLAGPPTARPSGAGATKGRNDISHLGSAPGGGSTTRERGCYQGKHRVVVVEESSLLVWLATTAGAGG
jgi:hypothetical protein